MSVARRSIMFDEQWPADSAQGRLLVDEPVERGEVGDAIAAAAERLLGHGLGERDRQPAGSARGPGAA